MPARAAKRYHRFEGVTLEKATALAICVMIGGKEVWIPRSVIHPGSGKYGGRIEITVEEWWAKKEGLI